MFEARIVGVEQVRERLVSVGPRTRNAVRDEVKRLGMDLLRKVMDEKLRGQVLNVRTGLLRRRMNMQFMQPDENTFHASVGNNAAYARIHEFGGVTRPHIIRPKNARVLVWAIPGTVFKKGQLTATGKMTKKGYRAHGEQGNLNFAMEVHHPGSKIPARPFLRPSLEEMRGAIRDRLLNAMRTV